MSWIKFSDKLKYYPKPCGWLKFLMNFWWPISCIACLFNINNDISNWADTVPFIFILNIIMALSFFACGLLARFLDEVAMKAIYFLEGLAIVRSIIFITSALIQFLGNTISNPTESGFVTGFLNGIIFLVIAIYLIQILIAIITIMYIQKRKDLFLSSEKEIKKLYQK
ncbi:MAG: hypothetical protein ACOX6P_11350 [Candidatus Merdivicinus sp.]|jgi:hypothetical protein